MAPLLAGVTSLQPVATRREDPEDTKPGPPSELALAPGHGERQHPTGHPRALRQRVGADLSLQGSRGHPDQAFLAEVWTLKGRCERRRLLEGDQTGRRGCAGRGLISTHPEAECFAELQRL